MSSPHVPLRKWFGYFLKLGATGFGGPVVLAHLMHRNLVEERKWVTPQEYLDGLALSKLCPGPLAGQLAMYLCWLRYGALGAAVAGVGIVLPAFMMVLLLATLYQYYGSLPWVHAALYGVGAGAVAVLLSSGYRLVCSSLGRDLLLLVLCALNAFYILLFRGDPLWALVASGVLLLCVRGRKVQLRADVGATLLALFLFFAKAGASVFGSGMAIVPALRIGVVEQHAWLTPAQFLDAVAVGMLTPGPLVIAGAFMGFLVAGVLGAFVAALGTFLPVYIFTIVLAPQYARIAQMQRVQIFVQGLTAAAMGAIVGAGLQLGHGAIVDGPTAAIATACLVILWRKPKFPQALLIVASGAIAVAMKR